MYKNGPRTIEKNKIQLGLVHSPKISVFNIRTAKEEKSSM